MKFVYQRSSLLAQLQASYAQPMNVADMLTDPQMPQPLVDWLAQRTRVLACVMQLLGASN